MKRGWKDREEAKEKERRKENEKKEEIPLKKKKNGRNSKHIRLER